MKRQLDLDRNRFVDLDSLRATVGDSTHLLLAQQAADRSITVVRDSLHIIPLRLAHAPRVLSITIARRSDLGAGTRSTRLSYHVS